MTMIRLSFRASLEDVDRMDRLADGRGVSRSALLRALAVEEGPDGSATATRGELLQMLTRAARAGSLRAMSLLRTEFDRDALPAGFAVGEPNGAEIVDDQVDRDGRLL